MQIRSLVAGGTVAAAGVVATVGPASAAITFDTFDTGPIVLDFAGSSDIYAQEGQANLDESEVFRGFRHLELFRFRSDLQTSLTIEDGLLSLESLPVAPGVLEIATVGYRLGADFDLTDGGVNDRFRVDVTAIPQNIPEPAFTQVGVFVYVSAYDMGGNEIQLVGGVELSETSFGSSPGTYDFLFADFELTSSSDGALPADFSRVQSVQLAFQNTYTFAGTDPVPLRTSIDSFVAVPEPTSLGLMAGAGGLLLRRRR